MCLQRLVGLVRHSSGNACLRKRKMETLLTYTNQYPTFQIGDTLLVKGILTHKNMGLKLLQGHPAAGGTDAPPAAFSLPSWSFHAPQHRGKMTWGLFSDLSRDQSTAGHIGLPVVTMSTRASVHDMVPKSHYSLCPFLSSCANKMIYQQELGTGCQAVGRGRRPGNYLTQ